MGSGMSVSISLDYIHFCSNNLLIGLNPKMVTEF